MAVLVEKRERGFNIAYVTLFDKPYAVYLGDCLMKSNLTLEEAHNYIDKTITNLDKSKGEN